MAYTQSDLESVEAAIIQLATGNRVAEYSIGKRSVTRKISELPQLRALRKEIMTELNASSYRAYRTKTSKGF